MLDVQNDGAARVAAGALSSAFGVHLWERARFLGEFPARRASTRG